MHWIKIVLNFFTSGVIDTMYVKRAREVSN